MGNSLMGNVIYFWIFIIGGMFIGKMTGLTQSNKDAIIFMIILAFIYWGLAFIRRGRKDRKGG